MSFVLEVPAAKPIEVVSGVSSPRKRGVSFDPFLDFCITNNVPRTSFPSRLIVSQGGSHNEEVIVQSTRGKSPITKGKKVWVESPH